MPTSEISTLVSIYGKKRVPFGFGAGPLESSDLQPKFFFGPGGLRDYTDDNLGSFFALAAHLGLRQLEDHTPSPGPVCIASHLQYEVDSSAPSMPEDQAVAHTTLLKEWRDRSYR